MSNFNIEYDIINSKYYNEHLNKLVKITTSEYDVSIFTLIAIYILIHQKSFESNLVMTMKEYYRNK